MRQIPKTFCKNAFFLFSQTFCHLPCTYLYTNLTIFLATSLTTILCFITHPFHTVIFKQIYSQRGLFVLQIAHRLYMVFLDRITCHISRIITRQKKIKIIKRQTSGTPSSFAYNGNSYIFFSSSSSSSSSSSCAI